MRLIDADNLKVHHGVDVGRGYGGLRAIVFKRDIDNAPTIEIVRCKECRYYNTMTKGCKRNPSVEPWGDNDFCSYGAKQTERSE